jgi:23S rRNA pseudouridine2605 synthase
VASRRGADELIKSGQVMVNGKTGQLNSVVADNDKVEVNGKNVRLQQLRYILLNKPTGYVTTLKDPHGRKKVVDLVDLPERIIPVGRLDYNTSGALLLTNDGELANQLMHPKFEIDKVYEAEVDGMINDEILNKLSNGIQLEDGMTAPAAAKNLPNSKIQLTIREGRNRQVRRMLAAVGLTVVKLHRPKYGPLNLDRLKPGQWRELSQSEVKLLKLKHGTPGTNRQER